MWSSEGVDTSFSDRLSIWTSIRDCLYKIQGVCCKVNAEKKAETPGAWIIWSCGVSVKWGVVFRLCWKVLKPQSGNLHNFKMCQTVRSLQNLFFLIDQCMYLVMAGRGPVCLLSAGLLGLWARSIIRGSRGMSRPKAVSRSVVRNDRSLPTRDSGMPTNRKLFRLLRFSRSSIFSRNSLSMLSKRLFHFQVCDLAWCYAILKVWYLLGISSNER